MRKVVASIAAALVWAALTGAGLAASGTALGVDKDASAQTGGQTRVLEVGADINIGDKVITDAKGLVEIKFSDDTKLVVGPNSALVIEDYLLRNNNSAGKFAINALSGTFRFVTGKARKDLYQITTPTGTIGVRGTAGDINVTPDLSLVMIYHGAMILCDKGSPKQCVTIDAMCEIGQIGDAQAVLIGDPDKITGADRSALKDQFPWATDESDLKSEFWVANARRCLNIPVTGNPQSLPVGQNGPAEEPQSCPYGECEGECCAG
jgi:hypothetical protein